MSSWFSRKVEKRESEIQGRGLFSILDIEAGEIVAVKGGRIMGRHTLDAIIDLISPAEIQIEDDLYIAPDKAEDVEASLLCLNHSCAPNVGVRGQVTFVAIQDIPAGLELTIDYAMIDGNPEERMFCKCGAVDCRREITGDDWRRIELQKRYEGYFSNYINTRIARQKV